MDSSGAAARATSSAGLLARCSPGESATRRVHLGTLFPYIALLNLICPLSDKSLPLSRIPLLAAIGGSIVTRAASRRAFLKMGRGVVTQDMLGEIGGAFADAFGEGEKGWGVGGAGRL